jgi:hypothetical protein
MERTPEVKSIIRGRGGKRPGAGRPPKLSANTGTSRPELLRTAAVEVALGGLERALKGFEPDTEHVFTPLQRRWHLAMLLFGVPVDTLGEALLKPGTSARFRDAVLAAIDGVRAEASRNV